MKLGVHVCGRTVANLYRERDEYVVKYLPGTDPADFISLTMPVREEPWRWPRDLHPFFRQNLPEGYLLSVIREEFGPLLDGTDLSLLAVVGGMGIGRVTVTSEGGAPGEEMAPLQVEQLLKAENTTEHFASLVRRYARASISGMVPKFIAPEEGPGEPDHPLGKPTLRTSHHIIKGSDDSTPYLGFNEFYTMRVLERLNVVPVAKTRMSDDGRVLVVDRFDVDANGVPTHGVEDACGLLGLPPHEKYATTTERVLNASRVYLPAANVRTQLGQFGWHLLTNYVVRNADFHAKNIALYYAGLQNVAYAPVYDVVTTQAYPRHATNPPGLSIDGRQTWVVGKTLERFFKARLGIAPTQYAEMVECLCESAVEVGQEVIEAARNEPRWHTVAKQMVHAWNEGMASLRSPKSLVAFRGLEEVIARAGFSDPERPESGRTVIGRSELLGRPPKR
ncbi:type II toxin-antitoxin system HipA family toxin [Pseudothauera rhizosphaerae]|uniref:Type II toxin-antitoxin system HipA family toxin n=1 Tax=Pseudothauera rhizosphaerae TaxID=2565932 RepID=A0A4S4AU88_9RHOO|nr:type II toxin-antitoxin system HipA family toxin [Pseudothauera rhizosphaerae]THF63334.1 type II toxin-antitoxin system HipA family toxin [Pseudothauera rhizosphaerae]